MKASHMRILRTGFCFCLASLFLARCGYVKKLKKAGDRFVTVLQKDDWNGFRDLATPKLQEEVTEKDFHRLAAAFQKLGKLKKLNQGGSRSDCKEERMSGRFDLKFSSAKVRLYIGIDKHAKLDSFQFKGGGMDTLPTPTKQTDK